MEITHILEVAEEHFFAKQYNDVKLDNIATALTIKKPSLYYYFENKRDFFLKTLKYSMKKYIDALREALKQQSFCAFIKRYLDYPSREQNLFAIAAQKGYGDDREINILIEKGKQVIQRDMKEFYLRFWLREIQIYLLCHLLDKLAMDNCVDGYCLAYDIDDLCKEIEKEFLR